MAVPADYGFEYSDDEPEEEDVDIENQYYNSKGAARRGGSRCGRQVPLGMNWAGS